MNNELVERAAKALKNHDAGFGCAWDDYTAEIERETYRAKARAVLGVLDQEREKALEAALGELVNVHDEHRSVGQQSDTVMAALAARADVAWAKGRAVLGVPVSSPTATGES